MKTRTIMKLAGCVIGAITIGTIFFYGAGYRLGQKIIAQTEEPTVNEQMIKAAAVDELAAIGCQYRIDIPLVDGTALHYNASAQRQEIVPDEIGTIDSKYMVVTLCPEGTESWVHYCIMTGGCFDTKTNTPVKAAHCATGGWCVPPFIYVTGSVTLSIAGYKLRQPLPSNVI